MLLFVAFSNQSVTKVIISASGVGGGGASAPPKVLICRKSGQNPWKSWKKWCPTFGEKHMKSPFFEGHTKKGLYNLCGRKFVGKSRTKTFRASLGKNPSHPQKFACSYTYDS